MTKSMFKFATSLALVLFVTFLFTRCTREKVVVIPPTPELYLPGTTDTLSCDHVEYVQINGKNCAKEPTKYTVPKVTKGTVIIQKQGERLSDSAFKAKWLGERPAYLSEAVPTNDGKYFLGFPFDGSLWDFFLKVFLPLFLIGLILWAFWRALRESRTPATVAPAPPVIQYIPNTQLDLLLNRLADHDFVPKNADIVRGGKQLIDSGANLVQGDKVLINKDAYYAPANQKGQIRSLNLEEGWVKEPNIEMMNIKKEGEIFHFKSSDPDSKK